MINMKMNNELKILYDSKTTEWLEKHYKILNDYEKILWSKIKEIEFESHQGRQQIFNDDIVRNQIIKLISNVINISIPISFKIMDLDKEKL